MYFSALRYEFFLIQTYPISMGNAKLKKEGKDKGRFYKISKMKLKLCLGWSYETPTSD